MDVDAKSSVIFSPLSFLSLEIKEKEAGVCVSYVSSKVLKLPFSQGHSLSPSPRSISHQEEPSVSDKSAAP